MHRSLKKNRSRKKVKSKVKSKGKSIDKILKIIDIKHAKKSAHDYNVPVYLKKSKKGTSLFAKRDLKKGEVVSLYKVFVYPNNHKGVLNNMYAIDVNGFLGDLYEESLQEPIKIKDNWVPFWGYFSNEPSLKQTENVMIDVVDDDIIRQPGDIELFKLVTIRPVKKDEELTWCYGESYYRKYKTSCGYNR